ncbi:AraC family transcriptional regulator [Nocardia sp. NPDC052316]|uniref:AraC family transcriptional regulator n=1 Tax=Nocardia sp. NPDC052316 TaxID=3364329 RepID=UPI0037C644DA
MGEISHVVSCLEVPNMAVMARAASLRGFADLVDELGGDGRGMLARFGIEPGAVESEDALVTAESMGWLLEVAAAEFRCLDFGLRLAARQDGSEFGPLSVAVLHSATVGEALECLCRYLHIQHTGIVLEIVPDPEGDSGVVGIHLGDPAEAVGFAQGIDHGAGILHLLLWRTQNGDYGLRGVQLPHPPLAEVARYLEYFGVEPSFGRATTVLRVPLDLLDRPVLGSDRTVRAIAVDYLTRNFPQLNRAMSARVRTSIESLALTATIGTVAERLSVHQRTLQRTLAAEGTSFSRILDETRRDVAYRLLCETDLSMARITALIGMQEQSALTRAARRWFGVPPQQVRFAHKAFRGVPEAAPLAQG